ncbi:HaeIII family restriction endonuclease [Ligilactobacillus sp. LYQ139]|uniref:HaeIII family restriction endonuclease n=1 Tax=Ligilactobacillus sp. LYQ139 TaxID=3378800 RepID=UPI003852DE20
MSASNMKNGKAFEYACLSELKRALEHMGKSVTVTQDKPFNTAKSKFLSLIDEQRKNYNLGAAAGIKLLLSLEPNLVNSKVPLNLSISPDSKAKGQKGDVRDVIAVRNGKNNKWEVGISCKHNHEALRHPRITKNLDFGTDWIGVPCSSSFFNNLKPVINTIKNYESQGMIWKKLNTNVKYDIYSKVCVCFKDEIEKLCTNTNQNVPQKLISYFFGSYDFYKIIMDEKSHSTDIQGFNVHGTLGKNYGNIRPRFKVGKTKLPSKLLEIQLKRKTTLILDFDNGWSISMRIHNKQNEMKVTSLAWDVKLEGSPTGVFTNTQLW